MEIDDKILKDALKEWRNSISAYDKEVVGDPICGIMFGTNGVILYCANNYETLPKKILYQGLFDVFASFKDNDECVLEGLNPTIDPF